MENGIITGAIFLLAFLSPSPAPQPSQQTQIEAVDYRVQKGDSLLSIAKDKYGSEEYFTTILNDNDGIKNPDLIEVNQSLKIRTEKPTKPENIKKEIQTKLVAKTNSAEASIAAITTQIQPTPAPQVVTYAGGPLTSDQINFLGNCEAGMNPARNSGNGYYGAFQFSIGTWNSMGTAYARADLAPLDVQIDAVQRLVQRSSIYTQFPGCSAQMRAKGLI